MNVDPSSPESIARKWWHLIDQREFFEATKLCADTAFVDWPLSNERMASMKDWQSVNEHYPGRWNASITELIADGESVVTISRIHNDKAAFTAISFFTIQNGLIQKLIEYWPDTYDAPKGRSQWVMPIA